MKYGPGAIDDGEPPLAHCTYRPRIILLYRGGSSTSMIVLKNNPWVCFLPRCIITDGGLGKNPITKDTLLMCVFFLYSLRGETFLEETILATRQHRMSRLPSNIDCPDCSQTLIWLAKGEVTPLRLSEKTLIIAAGHVVSHGGPGASHCRIKCLVPVYHCRHAWCKKNNK